MKVAFMLRYMRYLTLLAANKIASSVKILSREFNVNCFFNISPMYFLIVSVESAYEGSKQIT